MIKQILISAALACVVAGCYTSEAEKNKPKTERKLHSAKSPIARISRVDALVTRDSIVVGTVSDPAQKYVLQVEAVRFEYPNPKDRVPTKHAAIVLSWRNEPDAQVDLELNEVPPLLDALEKMVANQAASQAFPDRKITYKTNGGLFVSVSKSGAGQVCSITFEKVSLATTTEGLQQLQALLSKAQAALAAF